EPMHLDELGIADEPQRRLDGRIVPLDVPDPEDAAARPAFLNQALRLVELRGDRFLDQNVAAALEEIFRDLSMTGGRGGDDYRVRRFRHRVQTLQNRHLEFPRDLTRAAAVVVVDAHTRDTGEPSGHADMLTSEVADAGDGQADPVSGESGHREMPG